MSIQAKILKRNNCTHRHALVLHVNLFQRFGEEAPLVRSWLGPFTRHESNKNLGNFSTKTWRLQCAKAPAIRSKLGMSSLVSGLWRPLHYVALIGSCCPKNCQCNMAQLKKNGSFTRSQGSIHGWFPSTQSRPWRSMLVGGALMALFTTTSSGSMLVVSRHLQHWGRAGAMPHASNEPGP